MRHGWPAAALVVAVTGALLAGCGSTPHHRAAAPATTVAVPTTTPPAPPTSAAAGRSVPGATVGPVSFVDPLHGFGLRAPSGGADDQLLVASADGGDTWRVVSDTPLPAVASDLAFVDATDGYAWGSSTLQVTRDGGGQWAVALASVVDSPEAVAPIGADVWALAASCPSSSAVPPGTSAATCPVTVETSADYGASWQATAAPVPVADPTVLSRVDPSTAYVVGCPVSGSTGPGGLARTEDGGAHWQVLPLPQGCGPAILDYDLVALSADDLWLVEFGEPATDQSSKWVYRSDDGGIDWTLQASVVIGRLGTETGRIPATGDLGPLTVLAADPDRAWLAPDRGGVLVTTDGGVDWTPAFPDPEADAFGADAVSFLDADHGWAATFHGLWRTTDGTDWVEIAPVTGSGA